MFRKLAKMLTRNRTEILEIMNQVESISRAIDGNEIHMRPPHSLNRPVMTLSFEDKRDFISWVRENGLDNGGPAKVYANSILQNVIEHIAEYQRTVVKNRKNKDSTTRLETSIETLTKNIKK